MHWLIESAENLQELPEAFLSAPEMEKYNSFRFPKRRAEWLLGRWTAKRLLQAVLLQQHSEIVARTQIEIWNNADGVPYAKLPANAPALRFSLSHSNGRALCACYAPTDSNEQAVPVGADLEFVEPREDYLVRDYFTAAEQAQVAAGGRAGRDTLITALWSGKEAVLKALHKGLSVDTRAVEITLPPFELAPAQWTGFEIKLIGMPEEPLSGWWQVQEGYVLALVGNPQEPPAPAPLTPEAVLVASGELHEGHGILHHRIAQATRHHNRHVERD